ncbi:MAG: DUF1830 domain-containing protein [Rhizonema sp. PD38]|nr:DUF1830 domain-containing protein [Rhizonema sp. PD38]
MNSSSMTDYKCILCHYVNITSKIQIARISNIPNWYFERVVFPGQHLFFEAPQNAQLEVHTNTMATAVLSDRIFCQRLQVNSDNTVKSFEVVCPKPNELELSHELVEL